MELVATPNGYLHRSGRLPTSYTVAKFHWPAELTDILGNSTEIELPSQSVASSQNYSAVASCTNCAKRSAETRSSPVAQVYWLPFTKIVGVPVTLTPS